ncbi:RIC8B family protein [Megaselia abdita]
MQRDEIIELSDSTTDILRIKEILSKFNTNFASCFSLSILGKQWEHLWSTVITLLRDPTKVSINSEILSCIRILARDNEKIVNSICQEDFETLEELIYLHDWEEFREGF